MNFFMHNNYVSLSSNFFVKTFQQPLKILKIEGRIRCTVKTKMDILLFWSRPPTLVCNVVFYWEMSSCSNKKGENCYISLPKLKHNNFSHNETMYCYLVFPTFYFFLYILLDSILYLKCDFCDMSQGHNKESE